MIRMGGLLRHLLLDGSTLLSQANMRHGEVLKYSVVDFGAHGGIVADDGTIPMCDHVIAPNFDDLGEPYVDHVDLPTFLAMTCFHTPDQTFSVKDVIRFASHVQGGIHSGHPRGEKEHHQQSASYLPTMSMRAWDQSIIQVVLVVLRAMRPLMSRIEGTWGLEPHTLDPV